MQAWDELVKAALVGADRYPLTLGSSEGMIGALLAQLDASQADLLLLQSAAALAPARRAGYRPAIAPDEAPTAAEAETQPYLSARAVRDLPRLISRHDMHDLLDEWLAAVVKREKLIPPEFLPDLLTFGAANGIFKRRVRAVMGNRGQWLAERNPAWHSMADIADGEMSLANEAARIDAERLWRSSDLDTRIQLLESVRRRDAEFGRTLLESTWRQDNATERAQLLACLYIGLSQSDEPLLEAALDDRSKEVRPVARRLLGRLPESRLTARMIARTGSLVTPAQRPRGIGRDRLIVQSPRGYSAEMVRDQIERRDPNGQWDERLYWLLQMVSAVPLRHWTSEWELTPTEIVNAECESEFRAVLLSGWMNALTPEDDPAWAQALFATGLQEIPQEAAFLQCDWPAVVEASVVEQGVLQLLGKGSPKTLASAITLAGTLAAWSAELSTVFIRFVAVQPRYDDPVKQITAIAPGRVPEPMLEALWSVWADLLERIDKRSAWECKQYLEQAHRLETLRRNLFNQLEKE